MSNYILISAITFLVLGILWKRGDVLNTLIKIFFFCIALMGLYYYLLSQGMIVKL